MHDVFRIKLDIPDYSVLGNFLFKSVSDNQSIKNDFFLKSIDHIVILKARMNYLHYFPFGC